GILGSDRLVEQRSERAPAGIANGAARLLAPLEGDQRALNPSAKATHRILLGIEVDVHDQEVLELLVPLQIRQDGSLCLAGRAPGRVDFHEDRPSGLLRRVECRGRIRDRFRGEGSRGYDEGTPQDTGGDQISARDHDKLPCASFEWGRWTTA